MKICVSTTYNNSGAKIFSRFFQNTNFVPEPGKFSKIYKQSRVLTYSMDILWERLESKKREHLAAALTVLFTPWQTQILLKLAKGDALTDAERQELSRRIKPKLLAIESLQDLKLLHPFYGL